MNTSKSHDSATGLGSLDALFRPRSFAVIGASSDPAKIGGRPLAYAIARGRIPDIYPVNPRGETVQGLPSYPSIAAVPGPVECAYVAAPGAAATVAAIEACAAKGVRAAVVVTSGFAELGAEGAALQARMTAIARASGLRIVGPNCLGVMDAESQFFATFNATFAEAGWPAPGPLGIVSQSGAFGAHVLALCRDAGIDFSKWVTTGNECDVEFGELLAYLAEDPATRVILGYMEGCRDRDALIDGLARARANRKPVILLKVGRTAEGMAAAAAHTAAPGGDDAAFEALFRQYGAWRARSIAELVDIATACVAGRFPASRELGVVSISGGVGVLAADAAVEAGLAVPALPAATQARLKEILPFAATRNPVDVTGQWVTDFGLIGRNLAVMMAETELRTVLVFTSGGGRLPGFIDRLLDDLSPIAADHPDRLFLVSAIATAEQRARLRAAGFLVYQDPNRAVEVAAALHHFARLWAAPPLPPPRVPPDLPRIESGRIDEVAALALIEEAGIAVRPHRLVRSASEAARAGAALGWPVALRLVSPDLVEDGECDLRLLPCAGPGAARAGYTALLARVGEVAPLARIDGVLVAPTAAGNAVALSARHDPALGPVVQAALAAPLAVLCGDVACRVAPFDAAEARTMIAELKAAPLLDRDGGDLDALAAALSRLSLLAAANAGRFETIEVDCLVGSGSGAAATGARILPRPAGEAS